MQHSINILFVDDSLAIHTYITFLIKVKKLPIIPHFELNPISALDRLSKTTIEDFPEVIISDIDMPLMNGFEFIQKYTELFSKHNPNTLLYLSSNVVAESERFKRAKNHPKIVDFIPKPLDASAIKSKIFSFLGTKAA